MVAGLQYKHTALVVIDFVYTLASKHLSWKDYSCLCWVGALFLSFCFFPGFSECDAVCCCFPGLHNWCAHRKCLIVLNTGML